MNINTLVFLLGAVLLLVGIFGSGIELKELKIRKVGKWTRAVSIGLGLLFITLGLWMADKLPVKRIGLANLSSDKRQTAESDKSDAFTGDKKSADQALIQEGFEGTYLSGLYWNKGDSIGGKAGLNGFQKVSIDQNVGAENSKQSLVMAFKFGNRKTPEFQNEKIKARIKYRINSDLSYYKGIRFYIKSDKTMDLMFLLMEKDIESIDWNEWFFKFTVTDQWKLISIPFDKLKNVSRDAHKMIGLKNTDSLMWLVNERMSPPGSQGKIWLDQISLY